MITLCYDILELVGQAVIRNREYNVNKKCYDSVVLSMRDVCDEVTLCEEVTFCESHGCTFISDFKDCCLWLSCPNNRHERGFLSASRKWIRGWGPFYRKSARPFLIRRDIERFYQLRLEIYCIDDDDDD